ncbi:hypothetical protein G7Z17_g6947 [Cylindrodendrum hubeiense]|uniref:Uncharacterized protein n=1 Tax=Cylindrodendrum hubeiense TaxID=595255 RepID=A0A9P5HBF0_9HYPO|nr:hypothetical protein G7Z17_g6947 [Cylindrodendrum hubeiense]
MFSPQVESEGSWTLLSEVNPSLYTRLKGWVEADSPVSWVLKRIMRSVLHFPKKPFHLTFKMGIDNDWGEDQIRLVVAAPGFEGYLVVHIPSHVFSVPNMKQEEVEQFCFNIRDVTSRISVRTWESLDDDERVKVIYAANANNESGLPRYSLRLSKHTECAQMLHEAMCIQDSEATTFTQARLNHIGANSVENHFFQKEATILRGKLDDLVEELNALVFSVTNKKGLGGDHGFPNSIRQDAVERGGPSTRTKIPVAKAKSFNSAWHEYDCWDNAIQNPYLPTTSSAAYPSWGVHDDDPFSDGQSRVKKEDWWGNGNNNVMPGSWVEVSGVQVSAMPGDVADTPVPRGKGAGSKGRQDRLSPDDQEFGWDRCKHFGDEDLGIAQQTRFASRRGITKAAATKHSGNTGFEATRDAATMKEDYRDQLRGRPHVEASSENW